jgi:hypothetical protein|tara:strand:- start:53 stop:430 length:378 start_codon:yes stop_codon:yes gene_type:complete
MKKLFSTIIVSCLLLSGNAYAETIRLTCDGINTESLLINVKPEKNYIIVDDGKQEFEFQLDYIGKNKIEASKSSYKGFFTSKLVGSSSLTINTISGVGKFESYYDYKSGVPKGYNFLDYINCRFF